jgi:hypothetical protein
MKILSLFLTIFWATFAIATQDIETAVIRIHQTQEFYQKNNGEKIRC